MKITQGFSFMFLILCCLGLACSNQTAVTPEDCQNDMNLPLNVEESSSGSGSHAILGAWIVEFDLDSLTAELQSDRTQSFHMNVKPYLPPPGILINSYDPVTEIMDVDVTLHNPWDFTVYDVRLIIYHDDIGHLLINADDWTPLFDIPEGNALGINPFMAFAKDQGRRKFIHAFIETENLQILMPGGNFTVQFAIDASINYNCEEPYEISSFDHEILYNFTGSTANASVDIAAWEASLERAYLQCPEIFGSEILTFDDGSWDMEISNSEGAAAGEYLAHVWAYSHFSSTLALHDIVTITVSEWSDPPVCDSITSYPADGIIGDGVTIDFYVEAHDPDGSDLFYEWDFDWDGYSSHFDVDATGPEVLDHQWDDQGVYTVGCRITEDHPEQKKTICSTFGMQTGIINNPLHIQGSTDPEEIYLDFDMAMQERPGQHLVCHLVWSYYNAGVSEIHYSNNAIDPNVFTNHQIIKTGISLSTPRIAVQDQGIVIAWNYYRSTGDTLYSTYSLDGGQTFENYQFVIDDLYYYENVMELDICASEVPGKFYCFYATFYQRTTPPYKNYAYCFYKYSSYYGTSWPGLEVQVNSDVDNIFHRTYDTQIAESANGAIHTFWRENPVGEYNYNYDFFYDWSTDNGTTWHSDIRVSDASSTYLRHGAMAVDPVGSGYFTWQDEAAGKVYFRKSTFGDPPSMQPESEVLSVTANTLGTDIWVSPDGEDVIIPVVYNEDDLHKYRYYVSGNSGDSFYNYYERNYWATPVIKAVCNGVEMEDPNRIVFFNTFLFNIDEYNKGIIYGDYIYLAD